MRQVELQYLLTEYRQAMSAGNKAKMGKLLPLLRKGGIKESVAGEGWDQFPSQKATRQMQSTGNAPDKLF